MIRQQAFISKNKMLKGALHCHTTRSDGKLSPEEVIQLFKEKGYDFAALTDHRIYNFTNFSPETGITLIPGMEFDNVFDRGNGARHFHTVCIGPLKEDGNGFEQDDVFQSGKAQNQEEYQAYLDDFHQKNNLTIYCHPQWSATPARYFEKQKGNFAMEIWNSSCAIEHGTDNDAAYWDELLGQNIRIYGVATDDAHASKLYGIGWVMVNAENNVNDILRALNAGEFYSSCGPEIYDFYVEDNKAVIKCSSAVRIRLHSDKHITKVENAADGYLDYAEFELPENNWAYSYVRATVIDENGKMAWTNPIFL